MRSVGVQVGCQVKNGSTQTSQRSSKLAATQTPRTSTAPAAVQCRPQQRNQAVAVCPDTRDQAAEAIIKVKSTAVGEDAMLSDESDEENDTEHIDPSWEPTSSSSSSSLPPPRNQAKFIVFEDNLKQLLKHCYLCGGKVHHFQLHENGSQLRVAFTCQNNCHAQWVSQPKEGGIAAGNLLVSTAIVVTGLTYQRLAEFSELLQLRIPSRASFYRVQASHIFPAINQVYTTQKEALISTFGENALHLSGDGRCDSPGFSAKYGTYTVMEVNSGVILCFAQNQVMTGISSVALETKGCREVLKELSDFGANVKILCTDCSPSVSKMMRTEFPDINHQYDLYHLEKRIRKMLVKGAAGKDCDDLKDWIKPITSHLWWCAQNCENDPNILREKWISSIYHVTNKHDWRRLGVFEHVTRCEHAPLSRAEMKKKKWLKAGSNAHDALVAVVTNKRIVRDIQRLTEAMHTGPLENFHSLLLKYCPKRQHFSFDGMIARTQLAILDHNTNVNRNQAKDANGNLRYRVVFPKRTKDWIAKPIREEKSHTWREEILRIAPTKPPQNNEHRPNLPQNIASKERPPKQEVIDRHVSRFRN